MATRTLIALFLAAALGILPLSAQQPGDPNYEPREDLFEDCELLAAEGFSLETEDV